MLTLRFSARRRCIHTNATSVCSRRENGCVRSPTGHHGSSCGGPLRRSARQIRSLHSSTLAQSSGVEHPSSLPSVGCWTTPRNLFQAGRNNAPFASTTTQCHRAVATDAAAHFSTQQKTGRFGNKPRDSAGNNTSQQSRTPRNILHIMDRLLSMSQSAPHTNYPLRSFEQILSDARSNDSLLRRMMLSPAKARNMFILPQDLLNNVHLAIGHFSQKENFHGMALPVIDQQVGQGDVVVSRAKSAPSMRRRADTLPGPILCVRLLELIGIPHFHRHVSINSPTMMVHSSQVDQILECCLNTCVALSRSCKAGKYSLIGSDFNMQNVKTGNALPPFTAAQLAEDIWRTVYCTQIVYTSERDLAPIAPVPSMQHPSLGVRIGRIGSIGRSNNSVPEYLSAMSNDAEKQSEEEFIDSPDDSTGNDLSGTKWAAMEPGSTVKRMPWAKADQRRYEKSLVLFNSVLAAYARLSSSGTGTLSDSRREMVMSAERLLLEVANGASDRSNRDLEASPHTVFQSLQPDVISLNTVMKAWSEYTPKQRRRVRGRHASGDEELNDEGPSHVGFTSAERTESILKVMLNLWGKERAERTTQQSIQVAFEGRSDRWGDELAPALVRKEIAPNTSSFNNCLKAWSRSADSDAPLRGLDVFQTMVNRSNASCLGRELLVRESLEQTEMEISGLEGSFPDSRSFVLLLQCLQNLSVTIGYQDAFDIVEMIYRTMKEWDEQHQWSVENNLLLDGGRSHSRLLNVFSYNTLIKTLSMLPGSWDDSYQCCNRIDSIIQEMGHGTSSVRPNAVTSWTKCAEHAGEDKKRIRACAERAFAHVDALLGDSMQPFHDSESSESFILQAINDTIALFGRAGMPSKADELFLRAKKQNRHNLATLSTVIDALCENGVDDLSHVDKAKWYLYEFEREKMRMNRALVSPDMRFTSMYNALIGGYVSCDKKRRGVENANAVLSHMISSHESNPRHIARPNTTSFARVMTALARSGDNTKRLEELLDKMEALNQRRKSVPENSPDAELAASVAPNVVIYNLLLKSYALSKDDNALQSAMKLLGKMEADPDIGKPDEISNTYIMELMSRNDGARVDETTPPSDDSGGPVRPDSDDLDIGSLDLGNLDLAELNLSGQDSMPTSKTFNSLMNDHETAGTVEGAEKGAALLNKLEEMFKSGEIDFKPDIVLYNKLMNAWRLCEPVGGDGANIQPAEEAQKILDTICSLPDAGEDDRLKPNDLSFSICINAWCKSNRHNAAERAEEILRRKEEYSKTFRDVEVKAADYNPIIAKWKEDSTKGVDRASRLFEEVVQKYSSVPQSKPNSGTLNALLDVYAKFEGKNMAEVAEKLLKKTNQLYEEGKSCILPDVISYRSTIDAWVRQWDKDAPQRVDALVSEMIQKYKDEGRKDLRPDSNAFNLVLKACSHATAMWEDTDANRIDATHHPIAIANRTFALLKGKNEYGAVLTHATYGYMFSIYRQHMNFRDPRYLPIMQSLWKRCCRDGLVSKFTLEAFREATLERDFWETIGGKEMYERKGKHIAEKITVKDLPKEWSRNVSPTKRLTKPPSR